MLKSRHEIATPMQHVISSHPGRQVGYITANKWQMNCASSN